MEVKPGIYQHYKGNLYAVIGVGKSSENLQDLVVYVAMYDSKEFGNRAIWIRPLEMFVENVELNGQRVPRFTRISAE